MRYIKPPLTFLILFLFSNTLFANNGSCTDFFSFKSKEKDYEHVARNKAKNNPVDHSQYKPLVKSIIPGVISTPQSTIGSVTFSLSNVLTNIKNLIAIYKEETKKRTQPPQTNPELIQMITAANNQHGRPVVQKSTKLAPKIDPTKDHESFTGIDEKMALRFVEIYNFPVESMSSVVRSLVKIFVKKIISVTGPPYQANARKFSNENKRLHTLTYLDSIINKSTFLHLQEKLKIVGEITSDYLKSSQFKNHTNGFRESLIEVVNTSKRDTFEREKLNQQRDAQISYVIAFDLYPKLKKHFSPAESILVALAVMGRTREFVLEPSLDEILLLRIKNYGEKDIVLNEIKKSLIEYELLNGFFEALNKYKDSKELVIKNTPRWSNGQDIYLKQYYDTYKEVLTEKEIGDLYDSFFKVDDPSQMRVNISQDIYEFFGLTI